LRQITAGQFRKFDEELDADAIKMRNLATWEPDEAMRGRKESLRTRKEIGDFAHPPSQGSRTNLEEIPKF
jgi:hypothetical protein